MDFYNRDGDVITMQNWSDLLETPEYRIVAETRIGEMAVLTQWLGIDLMAPYRLLGRWVGVPPFIFETTIVPTGRVFRRYISAKGAMIGHEEAVAELMRLGDQARLDFGELWV